MISVLMGIHRFDKYVLPAIWSILNQEGVVFELVIVANGANAAAIAGSIFEEFPNESRLRLLQTPIGQLAHALNVALSSARYEYIARMDADDVSHPDRLRRQLEFIRNTGCDVVGSAARLIDVDGRVIGQRNSPARAAINRTLPFKNCFIHPTVMARRKKIVEVGGYNAGFNSEDYDLWLRLRRIGVIWENMPDALLDYRVHNSASQGRLLGYAEVGGLALRELLVTKRPIWMLAIFLAIAKALIKGR